MFWNSPIAKRVLKLLLGRRLPITRGTLRIEGPRRPVVIRRDRWGIPSVEASCDEDAFFALGFCHGQDRAFQIEMLLRSARGTVSALVGPRALRFDRLARRVGFHRAALRQLDVLTPGLRATVDAYAAGVRQGTRHGCRRKAHEFAILRSKPAEFAAADIRAILNLMSFAFAANWDSELTRLRVLEADGPQALRALDPQYPDWLPVGSPAGEPAGSVRDRLAEDLAVFLEATGGGGASNNWAIAGEKTASGRPILANDPHLPPGIPSQWYLASLRTPEWTLRGASFVGTPAFPVGHNRHAAWGITAGLVDNTDLFLEDLGSDGRSVRCGDTFQPCEVIEERIEVRGRTAVVEKVLLTPRGPLISPALEGERHAVSLRATWLDPLPIEGYLSAHRFTSLESFRESFRNWPVLAANMVYAGRRGAVAWQLAGRAPRRKKGWGVLPSCGWDPRNGWEDDPVPFEEMPHATGADRGFVASANQKPARDGDGPFLGADWIDGYRMARICEEIAARSDWDVKGCLRLQLDELSLPWREMREAVLAAPASDPLASKALDLLRAWDGNVSADSAAACVFEHFLVEMVRRCVESKAPRSASWLLGKGPGPVVQRGTLSVRRIGHVSRLLREQPDGWFPRPWPEEIADVLAAVTGMLGERYGENPEGWAWGRVRPLRLRHPLGAGKLAGKIFNLGPFPTGGDSNTIAQAAADPFEPASNPLFTVSLRAVMHVGAWGESRFVIPGGQSGNPFSPHYADQLAVFLRGEALPLAWTRDEAEAGAWDILRLVPQGAGCRQDREKGRP